jgi:hypothetical protein
MLEKLNRSHTFRLLLFGVVLAIILLMSFLQLKDVAAQQSTPPPPPTPIAQPVLENLFTVEVNATPLPLRAGQPAHFSFKLVGQSAPGCYGIPGAPVDIFFIIDNSESAGSGQPGSNLAGTRQILLDFVNQADQDLYTQPDFLNLITYRSRIGLISASTNGTSTLITLNPLTDDNNLLRQTLNELESGSDIDLAEGVRLAIESFKLAHRKESKQIIVLMLHDMLPINDASIVAVSQARREGYDVYLLTNSIDLDRPEDNITSSIAISIVDGENYFPDPLPETLRKAFVQMTGGNIGLSAREIYLAARWLPNVLDIDGVQNGGVVVGDLVTWRFPNAKAGQEIQFGFYTTIRPELNGESLNLFVDLAYLDCNGYVQYWSMPSSFSSIPASFGTTPHPTEDTSSPGTSMDSDDHGTPAALPPTIPDMPGTSGSPDLPSPFSIPLIGAILGFLEPLLTGLSPALQWLLLILLALLLLGLLLWLVWKWWQSRKPKTIPQNDIPPIKELYQEVTLTIPAWIRRLTTRNQLSASPIVREEPDFQDTLLIGVGQAGREILTAIAENLRTRFGNDLPSNIRLLQIDVLPKGENTQLERPAGLKVEQWVLLRPDLDEVAANLRDHPEEWEHWKWYEGAAPGYERARGRMGLFYDLKDGKSNSLLWTSIEKALYDLKNPAVRIIGTTFDDVSSGMLVDLVRLTQIASNSSMNAQLWLAGPMGREWSRRLGERGHILRSKEQEARSLATLRELSRFERNALVHYYYVPRSSPQDELRDPYEFAVIQGLFVFEPRNFVFEPRNPTAPEDDVLASMADILLAVLHAPAHAALSRLLMMNLANVYSLVNTRGIGVVSALGSYTLRIPTGPLEKAVAWRMVHDTLFESAIGLVPLEQCRYSDGRYENFNTGDLLTAPEDIPAPQRSEIEQMVRVQYRRLWDLPAFNAAICRRLDEILNGEQNQGEEPIIRRRSGLAQAYAWLELLQLVLAQNGAGHQAQHVSELMEQIENWLKWMQKEVHPLCNQYLEDARQELDRLRHQPVRYWTIDENLEWPIYQEKIRTWEKMPSKKVINEPLLRLGQRFGWRVMPQPGGSGWQLQFLAPPGEFTWQEGCPLDTFIQPRDASLLLHSLAELAAPLTQLVGRSSALEQALGQDHNIWLDKAAPRLTYNRSDASKEIGVLNSINILVAAKSAKATQLKKHFLSLPSVVPAELELCETNDSTTVTLLRGVDWLPLSKIDLYNEETWQDNVVPSSLYVWHAEQRASELESDQLLSPQFIGWLEADEELLSLFGQGWIYGAVRSGRDVWNLPGIGAVPGNSEVEVLQNLFASDAAQQLQVLRGDRDRRQALDELRSAVEVRKQRLAGERFTHIRKVIKERIEPLVKSTMGLEHDLGCYLRGLAEIEQQS